VPDPADAYDAAKDEDAAFFEDWPAADELGEWIWPSTKWRVIVVDVCTDTRIVDIIATLGGRPQPWLDRFGQRPTWHVPARHWRKLKAALPAIQAIRNERIAEHPPREEPPRADARKLRQWRAS
jgi:hypothetical protein